jgi:hypothetical protein
MLLTIKVGSPSFIYTPKHKIYTPIPGSPDSLCISYWCPAIFSKGPSYTLYTLPDRTPATTIGKT